MPECQCFINSFQSMIDKGFADPFPFYQSKILLVLGTKQNDTFENSI